MEDIGRDTGGRAHRDGSGRSGRQRAVSRPSLVRPRARVRVRARVNPAPTPNPSPNQNPSPNPKRNPNPNPNPNRSHLVRATDLLAYGVLVVVRGVVDNPRDRDRGRVRNRGSLRVG